MSDNSVEMIVEIPAGCRNKYEVDHDTGRVRLDRTLYTSMVYPADYGFIDKTLADDGDPLDALVLLEEPTFPGVVVSIRPVGLFRMDDENGHDAKLIAVPDGDPRWADVRDIEDVPELTRDRIAHFFTHYKELERGKFVTVHGFGSRRDAETTLHDAQQSYRYGDVYES
jgi:inorganic pyrophosphatase